jgi:hypothetical protein
MRTVRLALVLVVTGALIGVVSAVPAAAGEPTVTVSPNVGLTDGHDFPGGARQWSVMECDGAVLTNLFSAFDRCTLQRSVTANANGDVSTDFVVRRETFLGSCSGTIFCAVVIAGFVGDDVVGAGDLLTFAPAITVRPRHHLPPGHRVLIDGSGFTATPIVNDWAVSQCRASILTGELTLNRALAECDAFTQPFVFTHAGDAGGISLSYVPRVQFTIGSSTVRCDTVRDACAILVAQLTDDGFVGAAAPFDHTLPVPRSIDDCRGGGWRTHAKRTGERFTSKADCLQYVSAH